jgi:hypothetical protein
MRSPSQGPVVAPTTTPTSTLSQMEQKRAAPYQSGPRNEKRARPNLNASSTKENPINLGTMKKDDKEKALMDDLMAGLDASMFDGTGSSPVKSQVMGKTRQGMPSPLKTQFRERVPIQLSPLRATRPVNVPRPVARLSPKKAQAPKTETMVRVESKPAPRTFRPIKVELEIRIPDVKESKNDLVKTASKPVLLDEEEDEFTFDFDLDELAHMDDDLLLKPHAAAKVSSITSSKEASS